MKGPIVSSVAGCPHPATENVEAGCPHPAVPNMPATEALTALAEQAGVLTSYSDLSGEIRYASPDSLVAVLKGLGIPLDNFAQATEALDWFNKNQENRALPPVIVAWDGRCSFPLIDKLTIKTESSGTTDSCSPYQLSQNEPLPFGYYTVSHEDEHEVSKSLLISAPSRCFNRADSKSRLGIFAPFYALRSKSSWGVGDFNDARELIRWAGKRGVDIVGTLPLSAQFLDDPCEPSPYQPVSRLFWNELYIDLRRLPEYSQSSRAHRLAATVGFEKERRALADSPYVEYRRVAKLKRQVLEILAEEVSSDIPSESGRGGTADSGPLSLRKAQFRDFVSSHPDVLDYARFRASSDVAGRGHPATNDNLLFPAANEKLIQYYLYTQWIVQEQLTDLTLEADSLDVGLYLDLPLGSHQQGYDNWKYPDLFVDDVSIGAPPDPLGPEGQIWGIPPINPRVSQLSGHEYFREVVKRHTAIASMLRIDHVMGLHRLFWVPDGMPGSQGVYVKYPADELWAILSMESHRNRCEIVGEDLGTVPDDVREEMTRRGVRKLYVLPFEIDLSQEVTTLRQPDKTSVASLNTHDLVPFAGLWQETDITDRRERDCLSADEEAIAREERRQFRETVTRELLECGLWQAVPSADPLRSAADPDAAIQAAHRYLAASSAEVVLINIEDLWGETEPQNRPGTVEPIPNWRKKFAKSLEEIITNPSISNQLKELAESRGKGNIMGSKINSEVDPALTSKAKLKIKETPAESVNLPTVGQSLVFFRMSEEDRYLFNEGSHLKLYEKLGSHQGEVDGVLGTHFAVWAPDAESVHVIGDFNGWNRGSHPLYPNNSSGIWEGFIPGVGALITYKYFVKSHLNNYQSEKADPFAFHAETSPKTGSKVWDSCYDWNDAEWMKSRREVNRLDAPMSIYELHLGSWRRVVEQGERSLSYLELAQQLPSYLREMGFTHVQFLPIMEHPFYGSWGYQTTGYFAPTSRYGTPQDFMYLIDTLHQHGVGVILDWVPSHFPSDEHGLAYFDGEHLYEHADERQGFHPDWGSMIFNYGRNEVRSFLLSSGMFWLDKYHADGLRVDAVASMLYLDYSRKEGEWIPNIYGGRENLDAISFLRRFNEEVYARFPDVQVMAEESTSWPAVSRPTYLGGLGFGFKWDMGWMHDILDYFARDPIHRRYHHNSLTFRMLYAWHENFVLPLSHDEVVHGKGSLIGKMPGDIWQKFANLRLLLTVQYTQPGKKLLFMGSEIGQWSEWNHDRSLDWHLLEYPNHSGLQRLVSSLNHLYRTEPALYELDCEPGGFEWVDCNDADGSSISYLRWNRDHSECLLVVLNFTPATRFDYRVGVPRSGMWKELFNSDSEHYSGSGKGNLGKVTSTGEAFHGRPDSVIITLPPLGGVVLKG